VDLWLEYEALHEKPSVQAKKKSQPAAHPEEEPHGLVDENITCKKCRSVFVFTVGEQLYLKKKGYKTRPSKCKDCKQKYK
jgi:hypothetical protein